MNPQKLFFGIFGTIGLIAFIVWVPFTFNSVSKAISWEEMNGTVASMDNSGNPTVTFRYDGQTYTVVSGVSESDLSVGDEMTVHFPNGRPQEAEVKSFFTQWFVTLFCGIFVLSFGSIGGIGLMSVIRKDKMKRELFQEGRGRKVSMPLGDVVHDTSFRVNGRSPYVIVCQFHDKARNEIHQYKSEHIWFNPVPFLEGKSEIDVYIDPNDLKRYYVDISFLPKKA